MNKIAVYLVVFPVCSHECGHFLWSPHFVRCPDLGEWRILYTHKIKAPAQDTESRSATSWSSRCQRTSDSSIELSNLFA